MGGEIASSGGVKIDETFLSELDKDGDGRFDLGLYIYKNGKKVKNKRRGDKGGESIVRFRFELIKSPGYELWRVGSNGSPEPRPGASHSFARSGSFSGSHGYRVPLRSIVNEGSCGLTEPH